MRIQSTQPQARQNIQANRQAKPNFGNLRLQVLEHAGNKEIASDQVGTVIAKKLGPILKKFQLPLREGLNQEKKHFLYVALPAKDPLKKTIREEVARLFQGRVKVANCTTNEMAIAQMRLASALQD